jgi:hypothetical protein
LATTPLAAALRPASISAAPALCDTFLGPLARREAFDHSAQVVHVLDPVRLQRCHFQPAARRVAQYTLLAQEQQCLLHRLP